MTPTFTLPLYRSAIYGLRRGTEYLYIGQSTELLCRIGHVVEIGVLPGDEIDLWPCAVSELDDLERALIEQHNPKFNRAKGGRRAALQSYKKQEMARRQRFGRRTSRVHI